MKTSARPSIPISVAVCLWGAGVILAAPVFLRYGLYDFRNEAWYEPLHYAPLLPVVALIAAVAVLRTSLLRALWRHRVAVIANTAAFVLCAAVTTWLLGKGTDVTTRVCNAESYDIAFAIRHQPNRLEWRTEDYRQLRPGQCHALVRNFLRTKPRVFIHAAKRDELQEWFASPAAAFDLDSREALWFGRSRSDRTEIDWRSATTRCVGPRMTASLAAATPGGDCSRPGLSAWDAPFVEIPRKFADGDRIDVSFVRGGRDATMRLCNFVPYPVSAAVLVQTKRAEWEATPARELAPGACESIERNFQSVEPNFAVAGSASGEIVEFLHEVPAVVLEGDSERIPACAGKGRHRPDPTLCASGETASIFSSAALRFDEAGHATYSFHLDDRDIPLPRRADGELDVDRASEKIRTLAGLLPLRRKHQKAHPPGTEIAYSIGAAFDPADLPFCAGVPVAATMDMTPMGVAVPFRPGDRLIELDGMKLFALADLEIALIRFAESRERGGIGKLYSYTLIRGNEVLRGEWTFFFNPMFWMPSDAERGSAVVAEFGNFATFGFGAEAYCLFCQGKAAFLGENWFDYGECVWSTEQEIARLKQFHPEAYENGAFVGLFAGGGLSMAGTRVVARLLPRMGGSALATEVLVATAAGAAEMAAYTIAEAAPGADIYEDVRLAIRNGAGIGFATGLLAR